MGCLLYTSLDALVGLYERLAEREEVAAEGWCKAKVSYAVNLSEEGRITAVSYTHLDVYKRQDVYC